MRRDCERITKDLAIIQDSAATAKSFRELSDMTGLSYHQIMTTLIDHVVIEKKVREQIEKNKQAEAKKKGDTVKKQMKRPVNEKIEYQFVIDTSIASEIDVWSSMFDSIIQAKHKIMIPSIVVDELDKLQKRGDEYQAVCARKLLARAAMDDENFIPVWVERNDAVLDNCIINYCRSLQNKDVVLVTADKWMALRARSFGLNVIFINKYNDIYRSAALVAVDSLRHGMNHERKPFIPEKRETLVISTKQVDVIINSPDAVFQSEEDVKTVPIQGKRKEERQSASNKNAESTSKESNPSVKAKSCEIPYVVWEENQLQIPGQYFHTGSSMVRVISNDGKVYHDGTTSLKAGDNVLMITAAAEKNRILLEHYSIKAIREEGYAKLIYQKHVNIDNIDYMKSIYQEFIKFYKLMN